MQIPPLAIPLLFPLYRSMIAIKELIQPAKTPSPRQLKSKFLFIFICKTKRKINQHKILKNTCD